MVKRGGPFRVDTKNTCNWSSSSLRDMPQFLTMLVILVASQSSVTLATQGYCWMFFNTLVMLHNLLAAALVFSIV